MFANIKLIRKIEDIKREWLIVYNSSADIKGYLQDQHSQHVIIDNWNHHTLIKFQKWGVLIVKIVTKRFGSNLADKQSKFIPKGKLHGMTIEREKHYNYFKINGHVAVQWKTLSPKNYTCRKLKQLIKNYY